MTKPGAMVAWPSRWRRVAAFVIDFLIVGAVTFGIGLATFEPLSESPLLGRTIGFAAGTLYFGALCSGAGGGATVGMRVLGLRVASATGGSIHAPISFARAAVLVAPMIANGARLRLGSDGNVVSMLVGGLLSVTVFGIGLAQLYLLLFGRRSGKLLHDILLQTAVVRRGANVADLSTSGPTAKVALGIVAATAILSATFSIFGPSLTPSRIQRSIGSVNAIQALPEVVVAGVFDETTSWASVGGAHETVHTRKVVAWLRRWPKDPQAEIDRIGGVATSSDPPASNQVVRVELVHGFETGFSSGSHSQWGVYKPGSP